MPLLPMRFMGDPVLREKAAPVAELTDELRQLIDDMFETMYAEEGVGLAAPQVGVGQRIIVVDPREEEVEPFALVNPEIVEFSATTWTGPRRAASAYPACVKSWNAPGPSASAAWTLPARPWSSRPRACSPASSSTRWITWTASCSWTGSAR
jgi:hypothetical protein